MTENRAPFALLALAGIYLYSFMVAVSGYGQPFPLFGSFYQGSGGHLLAFADSLVSLYLVLGICKRQRLTLWLLIAYNLFDICNAWVNLALIPLSDYARLAGAAIPEAELRLSTLLSTGFLILLSLYVIKMRHLFYNRSPYLF